MVEWFGLVQGSFGVFWLIILASAEQKGLEKRVLQFFAARKSLMFGRYKVRWREWLWLAQLILQIGSLILASGFLCRLERQIKVK